MRSIYPVILCGGSGTRLWPLSRTTLPKQFLPLISSRSMLQETALLFGKEPGFSGPILVSSYDHRFLAAEQVREIGIDPSVLILEPIGRNTAPAVAAAALAAMEINREALLLVLPADLQIKNVPAFRNAVANSCKLAIAGRLVTFGIAPPYAETGYGYFKRGRKLDGHEGSFEVAQFVNKPDASAGNGFLRDGHYLWNSGMFVFTASPYLEELGKYRPENPGSHTRSVAQEYAQFRFHSAGRTSIRRLAIGLDRPRCNGKNRRRCCRRVRYRLE